MNWELYQMTVDEVLSWFLARARMLLGADFVGMYVYGSRALGGFDANSDIDFIIVTERELASVSVQVG